jgi:FKBP-type peptidyl-prolyl cis-trans isomerase
MTCSTSVAVRCSAVFFGLSLVSSCAYAQTPMPSAQSNPSADRSSNDAASYSLGITFGVQMHSAGLASRLSIEQFNRGIQEGLSGKTISADDQQRATQFLKSAREGVGIENAASSREFLARNAREPGIQSTVSGLQYKVVAPGRANAVAPKLTDLVTVQYRGTLLDGSEFDSSYKRGRPSTFRLTGGVIKGWQEALPLMKPGAKWQLFIPPDLAYGNTEQPGIPAGSLLKFDLELVRVISPGPPAGAALPHPGPIEP